MTQIPILDSAAVWSAELRAELRERILPVYLPRCRWFGGKAGGIGSLQIVGEIELSDSPSVARMLLLEVTREGGPAETYCLPADFAWGERAAAILKESPGAVIARCHGREGVLFDALWDPEFRVELLEVMLREDPPINAQNALVAEQGVGFNPMEAVRVQGDSRVCNAEHSNSAVVYGEQYFLKLYRKIERGAQRDAKILRFLSEQQPFAQVPQYCGTLSFNDGLGQAVIGLLVRFTPNQGDGWSQALAELAVFFERVLAGAAVAPDCGLPVEGAYLARVGQLGRLTAQMHRALRGPANHPEFAPEKFTRAYQQGLVEGMRDAITEICGKLRAAEGLRAEELDAGRLCEYQAGLLAEDLVAEKIVIHGDYHLGQVLDTGADFVIMDFEGEPRRSFEERALKRSPLVDVAGMLRSFDYAAGVALSKFPAEVAGRLRPWADAWVERVGAAFVAAYREVAASDAMVLAADFDRLLKWAILEKALYEVGYELDYRPELVGIPLRAVAGLVG